LAPAKAMPNFTHSPKDSRMKFRASVASVRLKDSADSVEARTMPIILASVEGSTVNVLNQRFRKCPPPLSLCDPRHIYPSRQKNFTLN